MDKLYGKTVQETVVKSSVCYLQRKPDKKFSSKEKDQVAQRSPAQRKRCTALHSTALRSTAQAQPSASD
jgi:hypothetical protein